MATQASSASQGQRRIIQMPFSPSDLEAMVGKQLYLKVEDPTTHGVKDTRLQAVMAQVSRYAGIVFHAIYGAIGFDYPMSRHAVSRQRATVGTIYEVITTTPEALRCYKLGDLARVVSESDSGQDHSGHVHAGTYLFTLQATEHHDAKPPVLHGKANRYDWRSGETEVSEISLMLYFTEVPKRKTLGELKR